MPTLPARIMWSAVTNPNDPTNWVLLRFASKKVLEIHGSGQGGRAECVANLKPDEVMFGGFVVYGVDTRGGVTSKRAKFIHFAWVGAKVRIMDRSRASAMGNDVSDWFGGAHMTLRVGPDTDDLDEIEIVKRLLSSGGAHKPKLYDFGGSLGPRTPEDITKGPQEQSDGTAAASGESKAAEASPAAPVAATPVDDAKEAEAEAAKEAAAEKKLADEAAAAEARAQKAAKEAEAAAKKREKEEVR